MPPVIFPNKMHLSQDKGISPGTKKESHLKREEQSKKYQNKEYQKSKWLVLQGVFSCVTSLPEVNISLGCWDISGLEAGTRGDLLNWLRFLNYM